MPVLLKESSANNVGVEARHKSRPISSAIEGQRRVTNTTTDISNVKVGCKVVGSENLLSGENLEENRGDATQKQDSSKPPHTLKLDQDSSNLSELKFAKQTSHIAMGTG